MKRFMGGKQLHLFFLGMLVAGLLAGCALKNEQLDAEANGQETVSEETVLGNTDASVEKSSEEASTDWEAYWAELEEQKRQEAAAWYDALTEEDFANAKTSDQIDNNVDWWQRTLILLGELPEVSARIYGEIYGGEMIILEYQGQRRIFSKGFLTPRAVMPEFAAYDYDGDGTQEIGMICYVGSGTGVAITDFSVFDSVEESFDTLYTMPYEEVLQFCDEVSLTYENGVLRIDAGEDSEEHDLSGTAYEGMGIQGLALGDITMFSFGESGEVYCDVALALALEEQVTPFFVGELASLYVEGAVPWEKPNFRFRAHYDGAGRFWCDGPELAN
ncbi:MAG: hypothetical protein K2O32_06040 [Acetatifactor sp.]|nr:hypothetical protein [Acetatifactor sp.]